MILEKLDKGTQDVTLKSGVNFERVLLLQGERLDRDHLLLCIFNNDTHC